MVDDSKACQRNSFADKWQISWYRRYQNLGGHPLRTYNEHSLALKVTNTAGRSVDTTSTSADLINIKVVLGLPWFAQ